MPQPISGHNCTITDNTETCITPPMIMTRLDQPGGASTPFNRIFSDLKTFLKEENKDGTGAFLKDLNSDELDQIEPLRLEVPVIKLNPDVLILSRKTFLLLIHLMFLLMCLSQ